MENEHCITNTQWYKRKPSVENMENIKIVKGR